MTSAVKRFFHPVQSCLILSLIVLTTGLCSCRSVPVTGRSQFLLTTESYENGLGAESYEEYKKEYPVSTNAEYNAALERCGNANKAMPARRQGGGLQRPHGRHGKRSRAGVRGRT